MNAAAGLQRLTRTGLRAVTHPGDVRTLAVEAVWAAAHLATYPLGVARERVRTRPERYSLDGLPPLRRGQLLRDVTAAGTPILLVHGVLDNRSVFALLRRSLLRRGFGRVRTINYPIYTRDVRSAATRLAYEVEQLTEEAGSERVHIVGHSLGGIIARYYVQRLGGDSRVHTVVTLGAPHGGTRLARFVPNGVLRQLRPDSDLIAELAEPAPGCRSRFVAFWSDRDEMVLPHTAARIDHPDLQASNILVARVGHLSMPIHREVARGVCAVLARLDPDRTAGRIPADAGSGPAAAAAARSQARRAGAARAAARRSRRGTAEGGGRAATPAASTSAELSPERPA